MSMYADSQFVIRDEIEKSHQRAHDSFTSPGTYWNGGQRAAIADCARDARVAAGLQRPIREEFDKSVLPQAAVRVAEQVAVDTKNVGRDFFEEAQDAGLSEGQYVETVGVVSRLVNNDVFARGVGLPVRPLGQVKSGDATGKTPKTATIEGAWVRTIPAGNKGAEEAKYVYGDAAEGAPFIFRSLSLSPDEARSLVDLINNQYSTMSGMMNLDFTYDPGITRAQVELLAARVSAINECFY